MSVAAFEHRSYISEGSYPNMVDPVPDLHDVHHEVHGVHGVGSEMQPVDAPRFDETDVSELAAVVVGSYTAQSPQMMTEAEQHVMEAETNEVVELSQVVATPPSPAASVDVKADTSSPVPGPQRVKPIPKPEREPTKDLEGRYVCQWPSCQEQTKTFSRRCEWSKHMDKHDRPYKCTAEGCEKLPGFTYSGGLLRHEREVHDKHGGPKNPLHCPHPTCKRHSGKGFSRQENLNEHLRRVHTTNGAIPGPGSALSNGGGAETDEAEVGSETAAAPVLSGDTTGKRKRAISSADDHDLREEVKRLRSDNEELGRQIEAQTQQTVSMMQQITELQAALRGRVEPMG